MVWLARIAAMSMPLPSYDISNVMSVETTFCCNCCSCSCCLVSCVFHPSYNISTLSVSLSLSVSPCLCLALALSLSLSLNPSLSLSLTLFLPLASEGHGTHVSGSVAGNSLGVFGEMDGMAPDAKISFFDIGNTHPCRPRTVCCTACDESLVMCNT